MNAAFYNGFLSVITAAYILKRFETPIDGLLFAGAPRVFS
jgi:hypothetical protein